jgi:hypothetical protein
VKVIIQTGTKRKMTREKEEDKIKVKRGKLLKELVRKWQK